MTDIAYLRRIATHYGGLVQGELNTALDELELLRQNKTTVVYTAHSTNDGIVSDCGWSPGEGFLGVYSTLEAAKKACETDWDELMEDAPFPEWKGNNGEVSWDADEDEFHYCVFKGEINKTK